MTNFILQKSICKIIMDYEEHCVINRSSHQKCSIKKSVLGNFTKFLFLNKRPTGLRPATLLKKRLWHSVFLGIL